MAVGDSLSHYVHVRYSHGTWAGSEAEVEEHVARRLEGMRARPEAVFPSVDALVEAQRQIFEELGWWNEHVEAMKGLGALAPRAEILLISGWVHPYGWLLDPEGVSKAILRFLSASR